MFDASPLGGPAAEATDATLWPLRADGLAYAAGGRLLLHDLTFRLEPGGVTALMGPNGAGKSLTLRLLAGLLRPQAGALRWGVHAAPPPGAVGVAFQRPVLLRRSVAGTLDHALRLARAPRRARPARLAALLEMAGLTALASRPARALSGGQQQRLALARAMAPRPALLLLDEPTAALDPQAAAAVEAMARHVRDAGVTVVVVTHDAGQARRLADRVLFLHDGALVEDGPAQTVLLCPQSAAARAYLDGRLHF